MVLDEMSKQLARSTVIYLIVLVVLIATTIPVNASIVVQDSLGRTVSIPEAPRRIVSLAPSITEILAYLNALEYVVGADSISLSDEWLNVSMVLKSRNTVDVGGYWWSSIKAEKILELNPDLVLADRGAHAPLLDFFNRYNITVVYLSGGSARSISDVLSDVYTVSQIVNRSSLFNEFNRKLNEEIEKYRSLIIEEYRGVRVLYVVSLTGGIWVAGSGTFVDDLLGRLTLVNAGSGVYGWGMLSLEDVARLNPDIIIVGWEWGATSMEPQLKESGLLNLGKPIVVLNQSETDILSRPGPLVLYAPSVIYGALTRSNITSTKPVVAGESSFPTATVVVVAATIVALITLLVLVRFKARRT
ncbi:MAG: ABC transporter substrate-binding protein [Desulfurococcus sp.]|nr:ABC transporter substrate-binding protein [Desulfurococcus sp.]